MPKAYVLINCDSGAESVVIDSIKLIESVTSYNVVYGVYDIIIEISYETMNQLRDLIQKRLRKINKIRTTLTLIPFDF
ncbi:MAG: Lrp/AsnC ligand binding domain-containing protein [Nitrososphaeraceae archaeon]